jgi:integrase
VLADHLGAALVPRGEAAGLMPRRPHDLRYTAVALWIAAGANPTQISTRAGHTRTDATGRADDPTRPGRSSVGTGGVGVGPFWVYLAATSTDDVFCR